MCKELLSHTHTLTPPTRTLIHPPTTTPLQAEADPNDPDNATSVKQSLLINLGNARYEHSIVRAAGGLEWRSLVEGAAEKFREAGARAWGCAWLLPPCVVVGRC